MFGAILTAMVTPFHEDGSVDAPAAATLMNDLIASGSDGLVICGTTGEASTLTDDEKLGLFALAVDEVGGRAPVIAGSASNDTAHSVELTRRAAELGVDGILAVTPYYNRPPRQGIIEHFAAIAAVGLPVVLYNIPSRTTVNMDPTLLAELAEIPNVVAVKQANPDPAELSAVLADGRLAVYAGNDDMLLPVALGDGAGVISVVSHLAGERMGDIHRAAAEGDAERAREIDEGLHDLYAGLFMTANPILVKTALEMTGQIPSARVRLPLVAATPVERDILRTVLDAQGILARA